jgi:hypothetical protein
MRREPSSQYAANQAPHHDAARPVGCNDTLARRRSGARAAHLPQAPRPGASVRARRPGRTRARSDGWPWRRVWRISPTTPSRSLAARRGAGATRRWRTWPGATRPSRLRRAGARRCPRAITPSQNEHALFTARCELTPKFSCEPVGAAYLTTARRWLRGADLKPTRSSAATPR